MDWRALPPLAALRAFAAYADAGSVVAAAGMLNVSHAAVSQQIRALEGHLGVALLDRAARPQRLTPEGVLLADALRRGFAEIGRAVEALTGAEAARPLQVSVTPAFAANWLMPRLARFRERHPDIDLMVNPTPALVSLEPGGIDVAVRYGTPPFAGLEAEEVIPTTTVLVAAPSLLAERRERGLASLDGLTVLQELGTSETTDWLARRGVEARRLGGLVQLPGNLMLDAARSGQGVAVTARLFVHGDLEAGRLELIHEERDGRAYHLVTRPGVLRPAARAFCAWMRREAAARAQ